MSGKTNVVSEPTAAGDRRATRRAATKAEIVAAAWDLVRTEGLQGLSMRELGDRVGMRAQSVYSYFSSKDEIYDAMFRQGNQEFLAHMSTSVAGDEADPLSDLRAQAHRFFAFCTADPVRYQLLFQRTLPGFEPSPESYAVAISVLERMSSDFARAGITDPSAADLATAMFAGLASQQLSNDPGGDRWERLIDRAVTMVLREVAPQLLVADTRPLDATTKPLATTPRRSRSTR